VAPSWANPGSQHAIYTGSPLDRAGERRTDEAWISAALADPETLWAPLWRSRNLMRGVEEGQPEAVFLTGEAAMALRAGDGRGSPWAFLGLLRETPVFAVDLSAAEDPLPLLPPDIGAFTDLRAVAGALPGTEAPILAQARGLLHWRSRHRFCGVCGGACVPHSAGHVMVCGACDTHHFPRTDPAVIMLVQDGDQVLLGHSARFPNSTMYSTLAGFVEPGESLEEAVAREVFEEAGVRVSDVRYHSSQPWPFPASIMLGFYARAETRAITIDPSEIEDARWFSRAQLRAPADHGFTLPRMDSIARRLIEDWIAAA
jgi:NAD+ diphosphatase